MEKMKLAYYPGCTLKNHARNFEDSALSSLEALDVEVKELDRLTLELCQVIRGKPHIGGGDIPIDGDDPLCGSSRQPLLECIELVLRGFPHQNMHLPLAGE